MKSTVITAAVLASVLSTASLGVLDACPHVPPDYKFSVKETTKEAVIYHDGVNAHLIIRTGFASMGPFPDSMAWIIPLPSLPLSYKVEDKQLFKELFEWCVR